MRRFSDVYFCEEVAKWLQILLGSTPEKLLDYQEKVCCSLLKNFAKKNILNVMNYLELIRSSNFQHIPFHLIIPQMSNNIGLKNILR